MKKTAAIALLLIASAPAMVFAQTAPQNTLQLANEVASFFNSATVDLIVLALVIYFYGVTKSIFKGDSDRKKLREQLMWGVLVIFFAVSIWGIVRLLQSTIFGQGSNPTNGGGGSSSQSTCNSLNC